MKGPRMSRILWEDTRSFVRKEREHGVKEVVSCMISGLMDEKTSLSSNYGKNVDKINEVQAVIFRLEKLNAKLKYNDKK